MFYKVQMLVALATEVAATQTLAQPCPKGYKLPPQVAKTRMFLAVRAGGLCLRSRGFNRQTLFKQPLSD